MTLNNLAIAAEKQPTTLRELLSEAAGWDAALSAVAVKPGELQFEVEGIRHSGEFLPLDQPSRSKLFEKLGAPTSYWEHHTPQFQAAGRCALRNTRRAEISERRPCLSCARANSLRSRAASCLPCLIVTGVRGRRGSGGNGRRRPIGGANRPER